MLGSRSKPPIQPPLKLYSVVIRPTTRRNRCPPTVRELYAVLVREQVPHEIVVVDDGSKDGTWQVLQDLKATIPTLTPVQNKGLHGFGRAVICGLNHMQGDACTIMMADASDSPEHAVRYWQLLNEGWGLRLRQPLLSRAAKSSIIRG